MGGGSGVGSNDLVFTSEDPRSPYQAVGLQERAAIVVQQAKLTPEPRSVPVDGDTDEPEPEIAERVPEIEGDALGDDPEVAGHSWWLLWLGMPPGERRRQRGKHVQSCKSSWVSRGSSCPGWKNSWMACKKAGGPEGSKGSPHC